jgi:hypothetical protein
MEDGYSDEELFDLTFIDPWWLKSLRLAHETEVWIRSQSLGALSKETCSKSRLVFL